MKRKGGTIDVDSPRTAKQEQTRNASSVCPNHYLNKKSSICTMDKCIAYKVHKGKFDGEKNIALKKLVSNAEFKDEKKDIMKFIREISADDSIDCDRLYKKIFEHVKQLHESTEITNDQENLSQQSKEGDENVSAVPDSPEVDQEPNIQNNRSILKSKESDEIYDNIEQDFEKLEELQGLENEKIRREKMLQLAQSILHDKTQKLDKLIKKQRLWYSQVDSDSRWNEFLSSMMETYKHHHTHLNELQISASQRANDQVIFEMVKPMIAIIRERVEMMDKIKEQVNNMKMNPNIRQIAQEQLVLIEKSIKSAKEAVKEESKTVDKIKEEIASLNAECKRLNKI